MAIEVHYLENNPVLEKISVTDHDFGEFLTLYQPHIGKYGFKIYAEFSFPPVGKILLLVYNTLPHDGIPASKSADAFWETAKTEERLDKKYADFLANCVLTLHGGEKWFQPVNEYFIRKIIFRRKDTAETSTRYFINPKN